MYLRQILVPLKSLRKKCSVFNVSPGRREPITLSTLRALVGNLSDNSSLQQWRTTWRTTISFYGFLRWNEVSNLLAQDLAWSKDSLTLSIKKSKTDQLAKGAAVTVKRTDQNNAVCPLNITRAYLAKLGYLDENCKLRSECRQASM